MSVRRSGRSKPPSLKAELNAVCEQKLQQLKGESASRRTVKNEEAPALNEVTPSTSAHKTQTTMSDSPPPPEVQVQMDVPSDRCGLNDAVYLDLCSRLPGRQSQIELLLTVIGEPSSSVPSPLYLYGNTGTGKTLTISTILQTLKVPHVLINCVECYSSKVLFQTVLNKLSALGQQTIEPKCDNTTSFVNSLQTLIKDCKQLEQQTVYIVLDHAERLREMEVTMLPAWLRLKELCDCEVCVVCVSELAFEKYLVETGLMEPLTIHFTDYTKSETLVIMSMDCDDDVERTGFHMTFINHIWNVFHNVCRDLNELRHLSSVLYSKYREPVTNGTIESHETRKLWKHIEPFFKDVMSRIYLRELSTHQGERALATPTSKPEGDVDYMELPHYSKYLLLASYLASYNPAKVDRRFFSKSKQPKIRKSRRPPTKDKPNYQLLGPKAFPLDRLMAIFYSIFEEDLPPAAYIYSQVSSLATLNLLAQISSRDVLDAPKYKCLVTLDYIRVVARSVGFDIVQYLYDFN